ncbi:MAG TPA: pyrimidine 5'-nucleotidase [Caulobacteraceae bacterium]|jgi:putative hydrolase of the HAD superfamily
MSATVTTEGADLRHVDTWLFDLDNTLYPLESGLALQVSARITDFVAELTGLPPQEAHALQKRYLAEHGLTLRGLMDHHDVDPDVFHAHLHDVPLDCLTRDEALAAALARLPGRRLIFTNADDVHAERVLAHLGLAGLFDDVFHIGSAVFAPKPSEAAFAAIMSHHAIVAAGAAFFEDAAHNLEPAAALGMTTVLVGKGASGCEAAFIDHRAEDLAPFLAAARVKEGP